MSTSPAFQFYPKEYLSSAKIAMMTPAQEGAYWRLLAYCWLDPDCSIPDDDRVLAHLSRLGEGWLNGGSTLVRECFTPHPTIQGRLVNLRLLAEREKQAEWRAKSSNGGRKSAESRRCKNKGGSGLVGTKRQPKVNIAVCSLQSPHNIYISPEEIYAAYPKKVGRPTALRAIQKAMGKICPGCLLHATEKYRDVRRNNLDEMPTVPHPATWFNQERYNDDPKTWMVYPQGKGTNQTPKLALTEKEIISQAIR
jgi:uncharacterized protein YdaU (DUF1376 family)